MFVYNVNVIYRNAYLLVAITISSSVTKPCYKAVSSWEQIQNIRQTRYFKLLRLLLNHLSVQCGHQLVRRHNYWSIRQSNAVLSQIIYVFPSCIRLSNRSCSQIQDLVPFTMYFLEQLANRLLRPVLAYFREDVAQRIRLSNRSVNI